MEAILAEWEKYAKTIPAAEGLDTAALRDEAAEILKAIARDLEQAQTAEQQQSKSKGQGPNRSGDTASEQHAVDRQTAGFSLNEMVSEYRALRASVIRLWTRDMATADRNTLYEMTRFNEAMDEALTKSIARYSSRLDRSRELFLGVLGHDLRNPLGAVLNSAQYLLHSEGLSGAQTKAASAIWRSGTRLGQMISDLLDVARTRLGQALPIERKQIDLAAICQQAVEEKHAYHPEHSVVLNTSGNLLGMWDEARLAQMISNLLENGIRHGGVGTPVTISAIGETNSVTLIVHNEGNPILDAARERIFEPLTRGEANAADPKKAGGLGLGLYIARSIAVAHGGNIEVDSSADKGTAFTVRLPRLDPGV